MSNSNTEENENSAAISEDDAWTQFATQRLAFTADIDACQSKEQLQRARGLIQEELLRAERAISLIRYKLNQTLSVSLLPPEVLSRIFLELREATWPHKEQPLPPGCWITATHVCRVWRTTALGCASLWADIPFHSGQTWAQTFISRSKSATLSIPRMDRLSESSWEYDIISSQILRVRNLLFWEVEGSDVATIFGILNSCVPKRLETLDLRCRSFVRVPAIQPTYLETLHRMPMLQSVTFTDIPLPWNALPWERLKSVDICTRSSDSAQGDLTLLLASLASTTCLKRLSLRLHDCPFSTDAQPHVDAVHLPYLDSFKFSGHAADFQRLLKAIRIPLASKLEIGLYSNTLGTASASVVSALLREHSEYYERELRRPIEELRVTVDRENYVIYLDAREANVHCASTTFVKSPFIYIHLELPPEEGILDSQLSALFQSLKLGSLRWLSLELTVEGEDALWNESTYRTLFSSSRNVEYLHVDGPEVSTLFEALVTPGASQEGPESQSTILFPSLRHLHLTEFHEKYIVDLHSSSDLPSWIQVRAQYAPIATLSVEESSISEDTVASLRAIQGLVLKWDGYHGEYDGEYDEEDG